MSPSPYLPRAIALLLQQYDFTPTIPSELDIREVYLEANGRIDPSNSGYHLKKIRSTFSKWRTISPFSPIFNPPPKSGDSNELYKEILSNAIEARKIRLQDMIKAERRRIREARRQGVSRRLWLSRPTSTASIPETKFIMTYIAQSLHFVSEASAGSLSMKSIRGSILGCSSLLGLSISNASRCASIILSCIRALDRARMEPTEVDLLTLRQVHLAILRSRRRLLEGRKFNKSTSLSRLILPKTMRKSFSALSPTQSASGTNQRSLRIATVNPGSIRSKNFEIMDLFDELNLDILAIQETRLDSNDVFYDLRSHLSWIGFCRKKDVNSSSNNRGGGVGFLFKKSLRLSVVSHIGGEDGNSESLWLRYRLPNNDSIYLATIYWRPVSGIVSHNLYQEIFDLQLQGEVIIMGDFNANILDERAARAPILDEPSTNRLQEFERIQQGCGLVNPNINSLPTHQLNATAPKTCIDHILLSKRLKFQNFQVGTSLSGLGHSPISVEVTIEASLHVPERTRFRSRLLRTDYTKKEAFSTIIDAVLSRSTREVNSIEDMNNLASILNETAMIAARTVVGIPQAKDHFNGNFYPWFDRELQTKLLKVKRLKKKISKLQRRSLPLPQIIRATYSELLKARSEFRLGVKQKKKSYWDLRLSEFNRSTGKNFKKITPDFWTFVYSFRSRHSSRSLIDTSDLVSYWGSLWKSKPVANEENLLQRFSTAMATIDNDHQLDHCHDCTVEEVESIIRRLALGKASDYHGIDNEILRSLPTSFINLLVKVFNYILRSGEYPECWRDGLIVFIEKPVKEISDLALAKSYRPITLLSAFFRLFEIVVNRRLVTILERDKLLSPFQAGFRPQKSTIQQCVIFLISQQWAAKKKTPLIAVLLDITKAFDSMSHLNMSVKMLDKGIHPKLVRTLNCLLHGHRNRPVKDLNEVIPIGRGAPQGSINGPAEFDIDIDDLPMKIIDKVQRSYSEKEKQMMSTIPSGNILLFADDTTIIAPPERVQALLDEVESWGNNNNYGFDGQKSMAIQIGISKREKPNLKIGEAEIPYLDTVRLLGVQMKKGKGITVLDASTEQCQKWDKILYSLRPLVQSGRPLARIVALRFIKSIFVPALTYGVEVASTDKVHQIYQNKALRMIIGSFDRAHIVDLHRYCGIWRLEAFSSYRRLIAVAKWVSLSEEMFPVRKALEIASSENLRWWSEIQEVIKMIGVSEEWNDIWTQRNSTTPSQRMIAMKRWKALIWHKFDELEAVWSGKEKGPVRSHALLSSIGGGIGFLYFCGSFNPPDQVEKHGHEPACYMCEEEKKDFPEHIVCECQEPAVVEWRKTYEKTIVERWPRMKFWQCDSANDEDYIQVEEVQKIAEGLSQLYQMRKAARQELKGRW